jgi:alanine dehydrogenase
MSSLLSHWKHPGAIMPVLYLTEDEVRQVLTMEMAIEGVEAGLRKMALEEAFSIPRVRCQTDQSMLHLLPAAAKTLGVLGFKAYTTNRRGTRFHVTIYDGKTGEMLSMMQSDYLGQVRTGAASAVATHYLSRPESSSLGIYGSGKQARTQVLGVCKVRKISRVHLYSRNQTNRQSIASELSRLCNTEVIPVSTPEEATKGMDIVCTATTSQEPVLKGQWLSLGMHLNIIGSNYLAKSEVDLEVIKRCNRITIDHKEQGHIEAGDFVEALKEHVLSWKNITELGRVITHRDIGRESPDQITLFKSLGIGLEDIVVAHRVFMKAKDAGIGKWLDL